MTQTGQPARVFVTPASFTQRRMWFVSRLDPAGMNQTSGVRMRGPLDVGVLRRAVNALVARHESLRTTFADEGGVPYQVIAEALEVDVPFIDLCDLPAAERERAATALIQREAAQPIDVASGPLLRVFLARVDVEEHWLLVVVHHIVFDGWSVKVMIDDLAALYGDLIRVGEPALAELELHYADYAEWERQHLSGDHLARELDHWRRRLAGLTPLELPVDRPRPRGGGVRSGDSLVVDVPARVLAAVRELARQEGVTLFTAMSAAFQILLARYTREQEIAIGVAVANRDRPEFACVIGCFLNTLVLRTRLDGQPSFRDLLRRVGEVSREALEHQAVPFDVLVQELRPERDPGKNPLFNVMMFQDVAIDDTRVEAAGVVFGWLSVPRVMLEVDLALTVGEVGREQLELGYDADLFDRSTIERMARHLGMLLESAVADPSRSIAELEMLTQPEREQLAAWNRTAAAFPTVPGVHQLFDAQAARTPDAVALVAGAERLSYRELDARACRLAHHLIGLGARPDAAVAIALDRSVDTVVAVLAVLKAGAGYLPLDLAHPPDRLAYMMDNARAPLVITRTSLVDRIPAGSARPVVVDRDASEIAARPATDPARRVDADNLAYIMYTSGSTGRPKGVALPHGALTNLIDWHAVSLRQGARVAQFASFGFDASFHELFAAWVSGGAAYLLSEDERHDVSLLIETLAGNRIEKLITPVVVLQMLAEALRGAESRLAAMREIIATGEQLQITRPVVDLFTRLPGCRLHNHYGPTESHVVTAHVLPENPETWPVLPPIGRPIANTQIHILDDARRPVPIGVAGDLHIGGICLARGYVNRSGLTAERFVPDPIGPPGGRLYRTGDLARWRSDGEIEYLGRLDHQVKIRGFRVELGEIESVLMEQRQVAETVAVIRRHGSGDDRIVAYVVPREDAPPALADDLRALLRSRLPDYMVPAAIVFLDRLPLTRNGKIDRDALPAPDPERAQYQSGFVAPRTQEEAEVAGIWCELLAVDKVGIHDNFFDLGGHSLLLTQLAARLRGAFDVDIPLRVLFDNPTVEATTSAVAEQLLAELGDAADLDVELEG